jgi:iron-sulfur cluster protein
LQSLPGGAAFRDEVRAAKLRCIDCLDELVDRFRENAEKRGAKVFLARDGAAAMDYVLRVARSHGARVIAKSKSLTSEEIEFNEPLEAAGMQVVETDLGELIIQLAHEKPFHLVFPAVHKTAAEVAELFRRAADREVSTDPDEIMSVVRRYLRPIFLGADIGVTGANIGIAENGSIVIETNEGNARLVSSIPPVHICIMGVEKIVETMEEALLMILAHPVSAVGQMLTTYVTFQAGRASLGDQHRETHIVLLDNGRTEMREDPLLREALYCIRCGACMNICPTYGVIGGHTFGYIYPGPIGIPWTAAAHGVDKAADFAPLCISCGLCQEICPAEIDIPLMIAEVKQRTLEFEPQPLVNKVMMAAETFSKLGSATAPLSNWALRSRPVRWLMEKSLGIERRRRLPEFKRPSFEKQFRRRPARTGEGERKVALFIDLFANYNAPELAWRVVDLLEAAGVTVVLPKQRACGYPYLGYGEVDRAKRVAADNVAHLVPYVEDGCDIVSLEPTATYSLRCSYPTLLASDAARRVAHHTYGVFEYLSRLVTEDRLRLKQAVGNGRYGFHIPCHERSLDSGEATVALLRQVGYNVEVIETGTCCGMAGTFGMKAGPLGYQLSQVVGEPLFDAFRQSGVDSIVTESSVCRIHLEEGTGLAVRHPLSLLEAT